MQNVLIVIHLIVVIALVIVVLLQRSEGGGLGIGGGGGGMMSARGAADALTRTTQILGAAFFITSLALGILARYGDNPTDILNRIPLNAPSQSETSIPTEGGILDQLGGPETAPTQTTPDAAPATPAAPAVPTE